MVSLLGRIKPQHGLGFRRAFANFHEIGGAVQQNVRSLSSICKLPLVNFQTLGDVLVILELNLGKTDRIALVDFLLKYLTANGIVLLKQGQELCP